ncbi:hypothetical protein NDU88_007758 [Pleurodeles waltl]|uniref:Uncharacterized protein n=1 Tax=Pleurodeles waltl TaxID=8319 RepID=A0AAV7PM80_PLEWA|nr:hypothetical protein NDU88_007758 [Pleurodeles waltl]
MAEEKVRQALALLEQVGCMDLVQPEAFGPLRPTRRSSAGVAAAVMACSPLRAGKTSSQVRRGGRAPGGLGKNGAARAGRGAGEMGPAWGSPKGNPRRAGQSRRQLVERGKVRRNEPGAACSARSDNGRGGGRARSGWEQKGTACWQSHSGAITEAVHGEGVRESPRKEGSAEESPFEVGAGLEEVAMAGQSEKVAVRRKRGTQAQTKDPRVPI